MKTIWKWTLRGIETKIPMPQGAEILTVQSQHRDIQLWALVDPQISIKTLRVFRSYGTGCSMPEDPGDYVGTVQLLDGGLVVHVFDAGLE